MSSTNIVVAIIILCATSASRGLKCHEGFNMTLNGIPLYYWTERSCSANSKCIGQEFAVDVKLTGDDLRTAMRYGACMSNAYADYLDCKNLFAKDSTFDPVKLLNTIPRLETYIINIVDEFSKNLSLSLVKLLSDYKGMRALVDGAFVFYKNLGFDFSKADRLKPSIADLLTAVINGRNDTYGKAVTDFFSEMAKIDTDKQAALSDSLRSLLTTAGVNITGVKDVFPFITTLIEKLPGLVRSGIPSDWQVTMWYDVTFKIAGKINLANWTKSTEDIVAAIKSSYQIPNDIGRYVNPVLDAMPDLARGLQVDLNYTGNWSLQLLKIFSEKDSDTQAFSTGLVSLLEKTTGMPLQFEYKATITWMPGLFYKFFPGDKAVIKNVYTKMADGFNSFDFTNITATAPETNLSMIIKNVTSKLAGSQVFNLSNPQAGVNNAVVVNFAKMFYDLLKVDKDYTVYIEVFATVMGKLSDWPNVNIGVMISEVITKTGGNVPAELDPVLKSIQEAITVATAPPFDGVKLVAAFDIVIASYQERYQNSPFPTLISRYINITYRMLTVNHSSPSVMDEVTKLNNELLFWNIDWQFAIIKSFDYSSDDLYKKIVKAWPEYAVYIKLMKTLKAEDVKELMKNIASYLSKPSRTTHGFIDATRSTFGKITKSIKPLMSELRQAFSPNTCRFQSCMADLCNNQTSISSAEQHTKATPATKTTTSHAFRPSCNTLLTFVTLWLIAMLLNQ